MKVGYRVKGIRKWFGSLTLTVLSDDVSKNVSTLRIPRITIPIILILAIIPILFAIYFFKSSNDLEQAKLAQQKITEKLEAELANQVEKTSRLQGEVMNLEEKTSEAQEKLTELSILETELREYMNDLPVDLDGKGGLDIQLTVADVTAFNEETIDIRVQSDDLIDRYQNIILNMIRTTEQMQFIPTFWPADSTYITSEYGVRDDPFNKRVALHTGIDIRGYWGDPVYASANGKVTHTGYKGGYGNTIKLDHDNGYETLYAHLRKSLVNMNQLVEKGELIGYIGSTGRSTGPHLHFEVMKNKEQINPTTFIEHID